MTVQADAHATVTVAVECSRLAHDTRGIGRYVRALLPRLLAQRPELRLVPFARRSADVDGLRNAVDELCISAERVSVRRFSALDWRDADLWWYPWNVARPAPRRGVVVATMHDAAPLALPDPRRAKWWQNRRWRRLYAATVGRTRVIITDSAFSALELQRLLDAPANKLRVIPLAADDLPIPSPFRDAEVLTRLQVRMPYVLAVAAHDRRKNLALLERAMPLVAELLPSANLVMIGAQAPSSDLDWAWRQTLGFVGEADLAALYRSARAVVVPSLYEGFGLPVLEAMRMGAPVICARTSSLPEVAGDAALYVSPTDERQLALAIIQLVTNDALRESLRRAGLERAANFSWDDTARLTLAAFDAALGR